MSQFISIGHAISVPSLRDYIIAHRIDEGDSIVVSPSDYQHIIDDAKATNDTVPDFPIKVMGVIIVKDSTDEVPVGKIQIVKNEKQF